jgi:hypothetical protein
MTLPLLDPVFASIRPTPRTRYALPHTPPANLMVIPQPITIHKPHPDPTLTPIMLRQIGKRLKGYYGWDEEDFVRQTQERAGK